MSLIPVEPTPAVYVPLASAANMQAAFFNELVRDLTVTDLDNLMLRASRSIEARCNRRFVPFTTQESHRAEGVDSDEFGQGTSGLPLDLYGALARDRAEAFDATNLVRHLWLEQYAPRYPEYWSYTVGSVELIRSWGDSEILPATELEGPENDTGHIRFRLGTFIPEGTTIRVNYSGGYTTVPDDLVQATLFQAAKLAALWAQPQMPKDMNLNEIDAELVALLAPYAR